MGTSAAVVALMMSVIGAFAYLITRARRDQHNPAYQTLPLLPRIAYWAIVAIAMLSGLMVLLMGFTHLTNPTPTSTQAVLAFSALTLLFTAIAFFLRFALKGNTYEEYENRATLSYRGKVIAIPFDQIADWKTRYNEFGVVLTNGQQAYINVVWFRPLHLLTHVRNQEMNGAYPSGDQIERERRLALLDDLLNEAQRP